MQPTLIINENRFVIDLLTFCLSRAIQVNDAGKGVAINIGGDGNLSVILCLGGFKKWDSKLIRQMGDLTRSDMRSIHNSWERARSLMINQ